MVMKSGLHLFYFIQLVFLFSLLTVTVIAGTVRPLFRSIVWLLQPVVTSPQQYS